MQLHDVSLLRFDGLIDGKWIKADSGRTVPVINPATGKAIGSVPMAGTAEARRAIDSAQRAFPAWARKTAKERATILRRWYELMLLNQDDLATLMTAEQGKPLAESKCEILYAASFIEWFSEEARRVYGDVIPGHQADKRLLVLRQPIGVVASITPWNFPAAMITAQGGTRACGRLHVRLQTSAANTLFRSSPRRAGTTCRCARGRVQCHPRIRQRNRR